MLLLVSRVWPSNHPVFASLQMKADRVNVKAGEERKAAMGAKAQLRHLTSSSVRADRMIFRLRHAANVAATATLNHLDSERAFDAARYEAAKSLNAVCRLLDRGISPKTLPKKPMGRLQGG